jgi:aryl-alcohol dehydrogenase-like predicted oxidoreductase
MTHRKLGRTGLTVSPLGFGAAPAAFLKTELEAAAKLVNDLLDRGLNVIDTAAAYPGSEKFIGDYLASRRGDYVLVSKCGNVKVPGVDAAVWSAALVAAIVERSLRETKAGHIDVMLLHSCDLDTLKKGEALGALMKAKAAGKIRHVGYSGDNEAAAAAAAMPEIEVIETSINYVDQTNIDLVLPVARQHDVGIIAKRPIANAAWRGDEGRAGIYVNYVKEYLRRHREMKLDAAALGFAAADWPDVALRFTLSFPEVSTAIVGTTNAANALRNVDAASKGPLDPALVTRFRTAFSAAPESATWTGQT